MSRKIELNPRQDPLQSPFAALDAAGLPPGPAAPTPATKQPARPARRFRVVLRREKAMRGGKTVLVISRLPTHLSPPELENLLKHAKRSLGCGGAMTGREIEIQGDQPDRLRAFLDAHGFDAVGPG